MGTVLGQESLYPQGAFRVPPYLQWPAGDSISVLWFSENGDPGKLEWWKQGDSTLSAAMSLPVPADALGYRSWEDSTFFGGSAPSAPYRHRIRLGGLEPGTAYGYRVVQDSDTFASVFRTAPRGNKAIRFMVYGDPETEPESTGNRTRWIDPITLVWRLYPVDQTTGYRNNLQVIRSHDPDLVLIAGDLVQHGGEQRDWDEFWKHNTDPDPDSSLGGKIPVLPAPGNHDYYEGPFMGGYSQPGSERAIRRYLTYFELPPNHSPNPAQEGRFYSLRYGPATFIVLDLCNNGLNGSDEDTNFLLLGEKDPGGGNAPGFMPGTYQYSWLVDQLIRARDSSLFTFVMFHHIPYSSSSHGYPPGTGEGMDNQSGVPATELTPLFMEYGVDAVFCGHGEIWERSEVSGVEVFKDQTFREHSIHFYDVGTGGDELRAPEPGLENPYRKFMAHTDAPEIWDGDRLLEGGKHYGHLEVEIQPAGDHTWTAVMTPVYVLPVKKEGDSVYTGFERKVYDDQVILSEKEFPTSAAPVPLRSTYTLIKAFPNPFRDKATLLVEVPEEGEAGLVIFDASGRSIRTIHAGPWIPGIHRFLWDGRDNMDRPVAPGIYYARMRTGHWLPGTAMVVKIE